MSTLLRFELPLRNKPGHGNFDISHRKQLLKWVEALPKANTGETARLLYDLLTETNSLSYSSRDRFFFLEQLRAPVDYIISAMKKHFVGISFPLSDKNQKIASAAREILIAMSTGYKIAATDFTRKSLLLLDKKRLATLLHRATTYSDQVLLISYQTYTPFPSGLWQELHHLYQFAAQRKLLQFPVIDSQHCYVNKSSLNEEYLRILLLSMSSPYHLRVGEAGKVHDILEKWVPGCVLHEFHESIVEEKHNLFLVDLNQDNPPSPLALISKNLDTAHTPDLHIVDISHLSERLREEITHSEDSTISTISGVNVSRQTLSHDLLKRLFIAWGLIHKRHFPRNHKQEEVQITLGLSATHEFITNQLGDDGQEIQPVKSDHDNRAHYQSRDIPDINEPQADVWSMVYPGTETTAYPYQENQTKSQLTQIKTYAKKEPAKPVYQIDQWVILNESANGYCMERIKGENTSVQVGELIGIKRTAPNNSWKWGIGIIRWMKFNSEQHLQMGIEMINPDATAAGIRSNVLNEHFQRSLVLPELGAINQPATLITSPVPWRSGNQVTLKVRDKEVPVTLTKSILNTGHFAQFTFRVNEQNDAVSMAEHKNAPGNNFTDIWSSL